MCCSVRVIGAPGGHVVLSESDGRPSSWCGQSQGVSRALEDYELGNDCDRHHRRL